MVLRWGLAQLLSRLSLARCTQTVCWLLLLVAGMTGDAAAAAVDVHPAARRDLFDAPAGIRRRSRRSCQPFPGDGLRVSRLVVDIWVVSCEMQREGKSPRPPGNPEIGLIRSGLEMLTIS